jgi:MFS family permease
MSSTGSRLSLVRESRDFRLLWCGNATSLTGDAVAGIALPLVAVVTLTASPFEVGLLTALVWVPQLVLGLPAGVWVDRVRRRPVLIGADLGRVLVVSVVPVAAVLGWLELWLLYAVAATTGVLATFFRVAWTAYLPSIVGRDRLIDGNSVLEATNTAVRIGGPGLGGVLVQVLTAPLALVLDAASFLVSAATLAMIRAGEPAPPRTRPGLLTQLTEGLSFIWHRPVLRTLVVFMSLVSLVFTAAQPLILLMLARSIGLPPVVIGTLLATAGLGGLLGALATPAIGRAIGNGRTLFVATIVAFPFGLLIPLTKPGAGLAFYVFGAGVLAAGVAVANIVPVTFVMAVSPPELLGRVGAVAKVIQTVGLVLGGLVGGAIGGWIGIRSALWLTMTALIAVSVFVAASPLRRHRDLPASRQPWQPTASAEPS